MAKSEFVVSLSYTRCYLRRVRGREERRKEKGLARWLSESLRQRNMQ